MRPELIVNSLSHVHFEVRLAISVLIHLCAKRVLVLHVLDQRFNIISTLSSTVSLAFWGGFLSGPTMHNINSRNHPHTAIAISLLFHFQASCSVLFFFCLSCFPNHNQYANAQEALTNNPTLRFVKFLVVLLAVNVSIAAYFMSGPRPTPDPTRVKPREKLSKVALQGVELREQARQERLKRLEEQQAKAASSKTVSEASAATDR